MNQKSVLFLCTHNSARSQIAEAWTNQMGGQAITAESAGLEPSAVKPQVIAVMKEVGIDLSQKQTQSVFELVQAGRRFDYVIALFDEEKAKRCPKFPEGTTFLRWEFPERPKGPLAAGEALEHYRKVRDLIRDRVQAWRAEISG